MLHIVQGHVSDAGTVYKTLRQKFSDDPYGHPYVEMATAFWETYQSTRKMYDGCAAAISYAAEHPEILVPWGVTIMAGIAIPTCSGCVRLGGNSSQLKTDS
jgi:hypothetical protein